MNNRVKAFDHSDSWHPRGLMDMTVAEIELFSPYIHPCANQK